MGILGITQPCSVVLTGFLACWRAQRVSEQLRKQNRPLRTKLQETINVIRTALAGEPGEHGEEGEQDSDSRLLRKLRATMPLPERGEGGSCYQKRLR